MTTVERPASIVIPAVNVTLPPRAPPSLPRPVPIVHSSAYLQQEEQEGFNLFYSSDSEDSRPSSSSSSTSLAPSSGSSSSSSEPFRGSALEWALQRVDRSLDEVELHPHPVQQQIYEISRGPVGQVTGKGLAAAAELTYKASIEAAKVAAPLGRWALGAGAKAAVGLVQFAMVEAHKAKEREKEGTRKEKKGKGKGKGGK